MGARFLGDMRRHATILGALLLGSLAACGDDGGATVPTGSFRLVAETLNGTATPSARLHGALELTSTEIAMGIASTQVSGALGAYAVSGDTLTVGGGSSFTLTTSGNQLTLTQGQSAWTFEPFTPSPSNTLPVTGSATLAGGQDALQNPRAAIVFLSSDMPFVPQDDMALTFSGGTATFDLSRSDGPLGIEVIEWAGQRSVVTSIGYVVVYDDLNGSQDLDEFTTCTTATVDCIRAVSPVVVAYRSGDHPTLAASQYGSLRSGWSHAVPVQDRSLNELGLASSSEGAYEHELTIGTASAVTIPAFDISMP